MPTMVVKKNGIVYEQQLFLNTDNCVYVVADGVKTYGQLLDELYALVDTDRVTRRSLLQVGVNLYQPCNITNDLRFSCVTGIATSQMSAVYAVLRSNSALRSADVKASSTTFSDLSSEVPTSGTIISLYYNIVVSGQGMETDAQDVSYGNSNVKVALDSLTSRIELKSATFDVNTGTGSFNLTSRLPDGATPLAMVCNTTTSSNKHCKIDRYGATWFGYVFNSVNSSGTAYTNADFNVTVFYV